MCLTGHTVVTIKNYLKDKCPLSNGHYDRRMPGKLAPYEQDVIAMRSKGITYKKFMNIFVRKDILERLHPCVCSCKKKELISAV